MIIIVLCQYNEINNMFYIYKIIEEKGQYSLFRIDNWYRYRIFLDIVIQYLQYTNQI